MTWHNQTDHTSLIWGITLFVGKLWVNCMTSFMTQGDASNCSCFILLVSWWLRFLTLKNKKRALASPPPDKNLRVYMERFVLEKPVRVSFAWCFLHQGNLHLNRWLKRGMRKFKSWSRQLDRNEKNAAVTKRLFHKPLKSTRDSGTRAWVVACNLTILLVFSI